MMIFLEENQMMNMINWISGNKKLYTLYKIKVLE